MIGIRFEDQAPAVVSAPNRTDIACFVGFVAARNLPRLPRQLEAWLRENGWMSPPFRRDAAALANLEDVPVPIDTWDVFDQLFDWQWRQLDGGGQGAGTYMGAAVRSFFAQGGRKCYVIRVGDPWPLTAPRAARVQQVAKLVPGYPLAFSGSPVERRGWHGIAHLFGLPDVSFLCLPDLVDAVAVEPQPLTLPLPPPPPEESFVECSDGELSLPADKRMRTLQAPRCDQEGYGDWAAALHRVADMLARWQREVQLVAAVPIPKDGTAAERDLLGLLSGDSGPLAHPLSGADRNGLASAFVQLAYPWVRTPGSLNLPEQIESPDAVLVGILARNALTRGTFRSAAKLHVADAFDVFPSLGGDQIQRSHVDDPRVPTTSHTLVERVSLFGPTPSGLRLLSDVTTHLGEAYRPAGTNRLVSVIVRAARRAGEDIVFEASSELLWARLRENLNSLLTGLLDAGALRGATPDDAFQVRCDRSTISQNDIDNGRVVAQLQFDAAAPIEGITVVLAMDEGGQVSLESRGSEPR